LSGVGSPAWSHKNEKDWPPIHSREQSLQIISMRGDEFLLSDFFAESLACFELDNF